MACPDGDLREQGDEAVDEVRRKGERVEKGSGAKSHSIVFSVKTVFR